MMDQSLGKEYEGKDGRQSEDSAGCRIISKYFDQYAVFRGSIEVLSNGTLHITASHGDVGVRTSTLTVTDPQGLTDTAVFSIQAVNVNDPPTIELVSTTNGTKVREGNLLNFTVLVSDPDLPFGDRLSVAWSSDRDGKLNDLTGEGELGFVMDGLSVGTHHITVTVSDGSLEAIVTLEVEIEKEAPESPYFRTPGFYWLVIAVVLLVMVAGTFYLWMKYEAKN